MPEVPRLQEPDVEEGPVDIAIEGWRITRRHPPTSSSGSWRCRVDAGRINELRERYNEVVVPALLETPGCRAVFLVEGIQGPSEPCP